jgi:flagellar export protein FliJ
MHPKALTRTIAIKERLRQWRRSELHEAETRVTAAEATVQEEQQRHAGAARLLTQGGECSANDLTLRAEQIEQTNLALKRAQAVLQEVEQEREVRRDVVIEATREVRAIEALRTRLVNEQRREADLREQRDLDEASANRARRTK